MIERRRDPSPCDLKSEKCGANLFVTSTDISGRIGYTATRGNLGNAQ